MIKKNIIQFNCNGVRAQFNQIKNLIKIHDPEFILLQELKINDKNRINFKGYKFEVKISPDSIFKPSVGILIKDYIIYDRIFIPDEIMAVGINTKLEYNISIFSYYDNQRMRTLTEENLKKLANLAKHKSLIMGDFNSKNYLWDNNQKNEHITDFRASQIINFVSNNEYSIMNDGSSTRITTILGQKNSAIDITIIHSSLAAYFQWSVADEMYGSDHLPTMMTLNTYIPVESRKATWNLEKTDWSIFNKFCKLENLREHSNIDDKDNELTNQILLGLQGSTPNPNLNNHLVNKPRIPWWNETLDILKHEKKKKLKLFLRRSTKENLINLKQVNAKFRKYLNEQKRLSWEQFINDMNGEMESKDLWRRISQINGSKRTNSIKNLKVSEDFVSQDLEQIADIIGTHFQNISSESNLSSEQIINKRKIKLMIESPVTNNYEMCDSKFTIEELQTAIKNTKDSAPGEDGFKYKIFKKLSYSNLLHLLDFYNDIWMSGVRPKSWNFSKVIPIPKQPSITSANQSRPINLINSRNKLMDKMTNSRLNYILEDNDLLDQYQFGFRKNRQTLNSMLILNSDISDSLNKSSHIQLITFDIEKAFDKVWPESILLKLKELNIGGKMYQYVINFLSPREFTVVNGSFESQSFITNIGIPQGSPMSSTLFILTFQNILDTLKKCRNIKYSAYADDLLIYVNNDDNNTNSRDLQVAVNEIVKTGSEVGLTFSKEKTKAIHFCNKQNCNRKTVKLMNTDIAEFDTVRILGIIYQKKHKWVQHIDQLKSKLTKDLTLIRLLSNVKYGLNQELLRKIVLALSIPKIRYGIEVYGFSAPIHLKKIDTQLNHLKRLVLLAFVTTPVKSLTVESGIPNINQIITKQNIYTMSRMKAMNQLTYTSNRQNKHGHFKIADSIQKRFKTDLIQIRKKNTIVSPWTKIENRIHTNIFGRKKNDLTYPIAYQIFTDFINVRKFNHIIYTDGSKFKDNVGFAGVLNNEVIFQKRLHPETSIFVTEANAILEGVKFINTNFAFVTERNYIIATDSMSVVEALENKTNQDFEVINLIRSQLNQYTHIVWIPGHMGIEGNETADIKAKEASTLITTYINELELQDFKNLIKKKISQEIQNEWNENVDNKLFQVRKSAKYVSSNSNLNRKERMIINRLTLGHTYITHQHVVGTEPVNICKWCSEELTVKHMFSCGSNQNRMLKTKYGLNNFEEDIINDQKHENIIVFLKELDYYSLI